jgi:ribokinase
VSVVAVVGSANLDLVIGVERAPAPGETLLGSAFSETPGGKGLNQALAAARLASTSFVGAVGTDAAGAALGSCLRRNGVGTDHLRQEALSTGRAVVVVTGDGENSIIVLPMSNSALRPEHVTRALDAEQPKVVVCQLEIPLDAVVAAEEWCGLNPARFVLNPSPVAALPPHLLRAADPLVVNRAEAEALLGVESGSEDGAGLARRLAEHASSVVVTGGGEGAWVAGAGEPVHVPGLDVPVKDTTGAGDAFTGTLAAHLALEAGLVDAVRHANAEAARIVQLDRAAREAPVPETVHVRKDKEFAR